MMNAASPSRRCRPAVAGWVVFFSCSALGLIAPAGEMRERDTIAVHGQALPLYPAPLPTGHGLSSPMDSDEGRTLLVVHSKSVGPCLLDVTVEKQSSGIPYGNASVGKGDQVAVNAADFPALAATGWHDEAELAGIRTITGKPVAEITALGRPGQASGIGFLAPDEDLISVLVGDNRLARRLGLRHAELARPMFHLWNLVLRQFAVKRVGHFQDDILSFAYHGGEVHLRVHPTRGFQESIFNDEIRGSFDMHVWRALEPAEVAFLRSRYPVLEEPAWTDFTNRLSRLRTGEMQPYYIRRYGFYEGHTDYRVDPVAIACIFRLRSVEALEAAFPGRLPTLLSTHCSAPKGSILDSGN